MWLLIHAGIKVNPYQWDGPQEINNGHSIHVYISHDFMKSFNKLNSEFCGFDFILFDIHNSINPDSCRDISLSWASDNWHRKNYARPSEGSSVIWGGRNMIWNVMIKTSWHRNAFRITFPLWWESSGYRWIPHHGPVLRRFDVFFAVNLNKLLVKQSRLWYFGTLLDAFLT